MFEDIEQLHNESLHHICKQFGYDSPPLDHPVITILPYLMSADYELLAHGRHPYWISLHADRMAGPRLRGYAHPVQYRERLAEVLSGSVISGAKLSVDWDNILRRRNTPSMNFKLHALMSKHMVDQNVLLDTDAALLERLQRAYAGMVSVIGSPTNDTTGYNKDSDTFNLTYTWRHSERIRYAIDYLGKTKVQFDLELAVRHRVDGIFKVSIPEECDHGTFQVHFYDLPKDVFFNMMNYNYSAFGFTTVARALLDERQTKLNSTNHWVD